MRRASGQSKVKIAEVPFSVVTFFSTSDTHKKTPLNPYSDCVYDLIPKITKKQKKLPFGNFLDSVGNFCRANRISIFQWKISNFRFL